jgi:hypothetical protein
VKRFIPIFLDPNEVRQTPEMSFDPAAELYISQRAVNNGQGTAFVDDQFD